MHKYAWIESFIIGTVAKRKCVLAGFKMSTIREFEEKVMYVYLGPFVNDWVSFTLCSLYYDVFVCFCLLGNLISITEKFNSFLRWLQSLAAYSHNARKRDSYHPWPVPSIVTAQLTREKGGCSRNKFL